MTINDRPSDTSKSDAQRLADAQFLLGMIERYRPGTAQEARDWFAARLASVCAEADASSRQLREDAKVDRSTLDLPCTI